jgi:hypothetical protein
MKRYRVRTYCVNFSSPPHDRTRYSILVSFYHKRGRGRPCGLEDLRAGRLGSETEGREHGTEAATWDVQDVPTDRVSVWPRNGPGSPLHDTTVQRILCTHQTFLSNQHEPAVSPFGPSPPSHQSVCGVGMVWDRRVLLVESRQTPLQPEPTSVELSCTGAYG